MQNPDSTHLFTLSSTDDTETYIKTYILLSTDSNTDLPPNQMYYDASVQHKTWFDTEQIFYIHIHIQWHKHSTMWNQENILSNFTRYIILQQISFNTLYDYSTLNTCQKIIMLCQRPNPFDVFTRYQYTPPAMYCFQWGSILTHQVTTKEQIHQLLNYTITATPGQITNSTTATA